MHGRRAVTRKHAVALSAIATVVLAIAAPAVANAAPRHWHHRHHGHWVIVSPTSTTSTTVAGSTPKSTTSTTLKSTTSTTAIVTPVTGSGCSAKPSSCGFPDATNTGIQAGAVLKRVPADISSGPGWTYSANSGLTVTGEGATISNLDISGGVMIDASNVTLNNVRVTESGDWWGIGLSHANNATIEHSVITSPVQYGAGRLEAGIKDVYGDTTGVKILNTDISHTSTGIQIANGVMKDNYIHDAGFVDGDHLNGITVGGGDVSPLLIQHNTIFNQEGQTDAISLFQDFGPEANKTIDNNLLAGGGYTVYAGGPNGCTGPATAPKCDPSNHIVITNNHFSTVYSADGGGYGPITNFNAAGVGNVLTGNTWVDGPKAGQPVLP